MVFAGVLGVTGNLGAHVVAVRWLAVLAVLFLFAAAILAFLASLPRQFHRPPRIRELRVDYLTRSTAETKLVIVDQLVAVYDLNRDVISQKLGAYRRAYSSFVFSLAVLVLAIVVRLFTK